MGTPLIKTDNLTPRQIVAIAKSLDEYEKIYPCSSTQSHIDESSFTNLLDKEVLWFKSGDGSSHVTIVDDPS